MIKPDINVNDFVILDSIIKVIGKVTGFTPLGDITILVYAVNQKNNYIVLNKYITFDYVMNKSCFKQISEEDICFEMLKW